jgi:ribonuclease VapC
MIVMETSAIVAVYMREPGLELYLDVLSQSAAVSLPATCMVEAAIVLSRFESARDDIERLLERYQIEIVVIDRAMARLAIDAFLRYGKGRGHPAQLNFGDCLSYAAARHLNAPLLYKGTDFDHTDIESALPR